MKSGYRLSLAHRSGAKAGDNSSLVYGRIPALAKGWSKQLQESGRIGATFHVQSDVRERLIDEQPDYSVETRYRAWAAVYSGIHGSYSSESQYKS